MKHAHWPSSPPTPTHAVRREELERALPALTQRVMQTTRVAPVFEEGALHGFRLDFADTSPLREVIELTVERRGQPLALRYRLD